MAVTFTDFLSLLLTLATQIALSFGMFIGFSLLRPNNSAVYAPRAKYSTPEKQPPILGSQIFAWVEIMRVSDTEHADKIGVENVMFLRFVRFCAWFFTFLLALGIPLCLVHFFSAKTSEGEILQLISMLNVPPESNLFWIHTLMAWMITFMFFWMMIVLWKEYIGLKTDYTKTREFINAPHNRTLLVTQLPHELIDIDRIRSYLDENMEDGIIPKHVLIGRDFGELPLLYKKHTEIVIKFEKVLTVYLKDPKNLPLRRPRHKEGCFLGGYGGYEVDSISFYSERINLLEREIYKMRTLSNDSYEPNSSAFIKFSSISEANHSALKLNSNPISRTVQALPKVQPCPEYDDLIWDNIAIDNRTRFVRKAFSMVLTFILIVGWTFLTSFAYSLDNLQKYSSLPGIGPVVVAIRPLTLILQAYVVPIITIILNLILPMILLKISRFEGLISQPEVEHAALQKFYFFMVFQFIVYIGAGVIESIIRGLLKGGGLDIIALFVTLGAKFVATSVHFMIISITGYSAFAFEIVQGYPFIVRLVAKYMSTTPREKKALESAPVFDFMRTYAVLIFVFFSCITYVLVQPLIIPLAAIFFWIAYTVCKYQLHYVYENKTETGGSWFPVIFLLLCISMIAFQLTSFGAIVIISATPSANNGSNNGKVQSLLIFVLIFITALFFVAIQLRMRPPVDDEENLLAQDASPEQLLTESRVSNPAMVKPLIRVIVYPAAESALAKLYVRQYSGLVDYLKKNPKGRKKAGSRATLFHE